MNCPRCGEYIKDDDIFCGNCGYKVEKTQPPVVDVPGYHPIDEPGPIQPPPPKNGKLFFILIPILSLLLLFLIFSGLLITNVITVENIPVISEYEKFLDNLIDNQPEKEVPVPTEVTTDPPTQPSTSGETSTVYEPTFSKNKTKPTRPQPTESFTEGDDSIPPELRKWADGLVEENRTYRITLTYSTSNINFRSTPKVTNKGDSDYNFICNIPDGKDVYVSYIYNGTWAVFKYNNQWGFSSIYSGNNPENNRIMTPID